MSDEQIPGQMTIYECIDEVAARLAADFLIEDLFEREIKKRESEDE